MRTYGKRRSLSPAERGDTLIEILVTVVILGIGVVGLMPSLANSLSLGDRFRKHSKADQVLTQVVEAVQNASYSCGDQTSYDSVLSPIATSTGNVITVTKMEYWTTANMFVVAGCPVAPNDGPIFKTQRLTVKVASADARGKQTVELVKRP